MRFLSISDEWRIWRGILTGRKVNLSLGCISINVNPALLLTKANNNQWFASLHQLLQIYKGPFLINFIESNSSHVLFTQLWNHWQFQSQPSWMRRASISVRTSFGLNFQTFLNCEFNTAADDSSVHEIGVCWSYKEAPRISSPASAKHLITWNNIHWSASWCEMAW